METYPVVTICGSMKFYDRMLVVAQTLTADKTIVLMPFLTKGTSNVDPAMLDDMHRRKIDLSVAIVVVTDESGYIGDSTKGEVEYARETGKSINYVRVRSSSGEQPQHEG